MKKIKATSLRLESNILAKDKLIALKNMELVQAEKSTIYSGEIIRINIPPGVEYDTGIKGNGVFQINNDSAGIVAIIALGYQAETGIVIWESLPRHSVSASSSRDVLVYRKSTNSSILIKNNNSSSSILGYFRAI